MPPHGHSCEGDNNHHESPETGLEYSLYAKIDRENLECLNEAVDGSGKTIFKPWEERLNFNVVGTKYYDFLVSKMVNTYLHFMLCSMWNRMQTRNCCLIYLLLEM